jgi:hypothetical protein
MTNTLTLKSLFVFLLLSLGFSQASVAQTVIWEEHFDSQSETAANWVSGGTNPGTVEWAWTNNINAGNQNPFNFGENVPGTSTTTGYVWFDSDANGENAHDVTFTGTGVPANTQGYEDVHLRFYTEDIVYTAEHNVSVGISTDGGTTFTYYDIPELNVLGQNEYYAGWIDLAVPAANDAAEVIVQFRYQGNYEYWWKIDDVSLYDFEVLPVNVTFRVNTALITVDTAGMFIAGEFNGWTDQPMVDQGNGIWTATVSLIPGDTIQYKFKNGHDGWETVTAECGVDDGFGGFNRQIIVPVIGTTLPIVCFSECTNCEVPCELNPGAIICDDFEDYTLGVISPQSPWWAPWSGTETDAIVNADVTNAEASNGTQAMVIQWEVQGSTQGNDQILQLGDSTSGNYELSWQVYIPAGKAGYYNIQNTQTPGTLWNLDVFFDSTGIGRYDLNSSAAQGIDGTFAFPHDQWFEVRHLIDLDNNIAKLYINDSYIAGWAYTGNLGGVDFYALTAWDLMYIDEVAYIELPAEVFNSDLCESSVDLTPYFGGTPNVPVVTPLYSNATASVSATDPVPSCFQDSPVATLNNTVWFNFTGDGNRYNIETIECNADTAYIEDGDTQMAIFAGECGDFTEVACNEDIDFDNGDYRAGVFDFEAVQGVEYSILIDGWGNATGTVQEGAFCIQITALPSISCDAGQVGDYTLDNNGFVCADQEAADILTIDPSGFVLPTVGPEYGMAWALTATPVGPNQFPTELGADYLTSTGLVTSVFEVGGVSLASGFPAGGYYLTPVVVAGAVDTDPSDPAFLDQLDLTNACFFVGTSQLVFLVPEVEDLFATANVTDPTGGQNNGSITLDVTGGLPGFIGDPTVLDYNYSWTGPNGFTSTEPALTDLAPGVYSVTISDPTNCVTPIVLSTITVSAKDPVSVTALNLQPNPTTGSLQLQLQLVEAADVRIDVLNTLGQVLQTSQAGRVNSLQQVIDLRSVANGAYFVRVVIDGETAVRRVVVQH